MEAVPESKVQAIVRPDDPAQEHRGALGGRGVWVGEKVAGTGPGKIVFRRRFVVRQCCLTEPPDGRRQVRPSAGSADDASAEQSLQRPVLSEDAAQHDRESDEVPGARPAVPEAAQRGSLPPRFEFPHEARGMRPDPREDALERGAHGPGVPVGKRRGEVRRNLPIVSAPETPRKLEGVGVETTGAVPPEHALDGVFPTARRHQRPVTGRRLANRPPALRPRSRRPAPSGRAPRTECSAPGSGTTPGRSCRWPRGRAG